MRYGVKHWCSLALVVAMLNIAACGYLVYPERQGLRGDRVDGTVVALDAVGLLFLILPGVIAFAVDFSTGCIYLPKDKAGPFSMNAIPASSTPEGWKLVAQVEPFADDATIAAALKKSLGFNQADTNTAGIEWQSIPVVAPSLRAN